MKRINYSQILYGMSIFCLFLALGLILNLSDKYRIDEILLFYSCTFLIFSGFAVGILNRRSLNRIEKKLGNSGNRSLFDRFHKLEQDLNKVLRNKIRHDLRVESNIVYQRVEALYKINNEILPRSPLPSMSGWALSPDAAWFLVQTIQEHNPKTIVDLGSGLSTILSGYLLEKKGGRVLSVDHDNNYVQKTTELVDKHGLSSCIEMIEAPLVNKKIGGKNYKWYDLNLKPNDRIDLLLIDGPPGPLQKNARYPALPVLYKHLSKSAIILVDDYYREDEQEIVKRWLKQFKDLELTVINNEKGMAVLERKA